MNYLEHSHQSLYTDLQLCGSQTIRFGGPYKNIIAVLFMQLSCESPQLDKLFDYIHFWKPCSHQNPMYARAMSTQPPKLEAVGELGHVPSIGG